jgi:hypothetical protein
MNHVPLIVSVVLVAFFLGFVYGTLRERQRWNKRLVAARLNRATAQSLDDSFLDSSYGE